MRMEHKIWMTLLVPAALCAIPAAMAAWWFSGPLAAGITAGACLVPASVTAAWIVRQARDVGAQLRRPELRDEVQSGAGLYGEFLQDAIAELQRLEDEADRATATKTQLEARARVRQRHCQQLESAMSTVDVPVLITDTHDKLLFSNSAASALLGRPAGENGHGDRLTFDPSRYPELCELWEAARTHSTATNQRSCEFALDTDDGPVSYRAVATNIYDGSSLVAVATTLHNIAEEQKEKTRHAQFVSSVCHELKTPMASIKAYTELLMDGEVCEPDEQQELFGFIDDQVDRLTRLVNNMLNLARIESGVIEVNRADCGLNDVLKKTVSLVEPAAQEKNISLVSELSELYLPVHVDRDLFGQAIINLMSNAVKYTPDGGEVRLRSRMEEDRAIVEVRDNGMGIPEESLPHIFERFYRVPENNKAAAGTGLGLSVVHSIVAELHNGHVAVRSGRNQGTCFTVTIPLGHRYQNRKKSESAVCVS